MIMLMNSDGEIFIDTKEINHNLEDFEKVKKQEAGMKNESDKSNNKGWI